MEKGAWELTQTGERINPVPPLPTESCRQQHAHTDSHTQFLALDSPSNTAARVRHVLHGRLHAQALFSDLQILAWGGGKGTGAAGRGLGSRGSCEHRPIPLRT